MDLTSFFIVVASITAVVSGFVFLLKMQDRYMEKARGYDDDGSLRV